MQRSEAKRAGWLAAAPFVMQRYCKSGEEQNNRFVFCPMAACPEQEPALMPTSKQTVEYTKRWIQKPCAKACAFFNVC